jgi:hypothetical protein
MDLLDTLGFWATLIICSVLLLCPIYLWARWAYRAYKRKDWLEFAIALGSLLLFLKTVTLPIIETDPKQRAELKTYGTVRDYLPILAFVISIFIPTAFFVRKWILTSLKNGKRIVNFLQICVITLLIISSIYIPLSFYLTNRIWMGRNLGIHIPFSGSTIDYIIYPKILDYPDGSVRATVQFDEQTAADLERQIESIPYFGPERLALFGNTMLPWNKSYQQKCKEVKDYLFDKGLTGLWYFDKKEQVYRFYEPRIGKSDEHYTEPNAQILFNRSYRIVASLNPKTRTLYYQFIPHN